MLVHNYLRHAAQKASDRTAVWFNGQWLTYGEIEQQSNQIANALIDLGVMPGDRVALAFENSFNYVSAYYGALKAGAGVVPLNTDMTASGLQYYLNHSGTKILITASKFIKYLHECIPHVSQLSGMITDQEDLAPFEGFQNLKVWQLQEIYAEQSHQDPDVRRIDLDLASIVYTSGSTGQPKGVTLSHLNVTSNTQSIVEYLSLTHHDRIMAVLPFYYIYGKSLLNTHFAVGGSVVIDNRFMFPQAILSSMQENAVTGFAGVPSTFMILLNRSNVRDTTFESLRYVTQAGGSLAPHLQKEVAQAFAPAQLYVMYGATEAAPRLAYLKPEDLERKQGSIGTAIPNVDLKVVDKQGNPVRADETGEIAARGSNIMMGYWNDPEATAEVIKEGFYYSGDLARMDEDGFIYIVGRTRDIIKAGGFRVSANEVEDMILQMADVEEVAVVGVKDDILGEAIKAFVVFKKETNASPQDLSQFLKGRLPDYKCPKHVELLSQLPKMPNGKIDKTSLRASSEKQASL